MKKIHIIFCFIALAISFTTGCKKTGTYQTALLTDYLQLQTGKSITYRLDSTNFVFFGTIDSVTSYTVQDVVDTLFTDNLSRPSWRVLRYITDTAQSTGWQDNETYQVTPTRQTVEVIENNLRYLKLSLPLVNGFNWPGNTYIDTNTPDTSIDADFSYLAGWNYTYDSIGSPYTVLAGTVPNTLIIRQQDQMIGDSTDKAAFSERDYSVEVYGKGIGLIYKDFLHWEYQPPNGSNAAGYRTGYGIRLNMIGHN
jgi:hypothetical protein